MKIDMAIDEGNQLLDADTVLFARSYQLDALEKALKGNTIVYLETGSGKTLIAIMLLRSYAHLLRKPSPFIAVFLVPTVVLVTQQGEYIEMHTDLKVGKYYGELGVDFWDAATWKREKDEHEVLVMTPAILYRALSHRFLGLDRIKVLIFDECHNARRNHDYARIMKDFYNRQREENALHLPRIFGMTASPIKAKGSCSAADYWEQIRQLENLMNSKVFTCESESVLAQYIPFSTPKVKMYEHVDAPCVIVECIASRLERLIKKHKLSLERSSISISAAESAKERLSNLCSTFKFCLTELGVWLAIKAAEMLSCEVTNIFSWVTLDVRCDKVVRDFSLDALEVFYAFVPSGPQWSNCYDIKAKLNSGFVTSKVACLVNTLLEYREIKDLRCIVFVERIITAIVLRNLLNELLPEVSGWRAEYTAGNNSKLQSQSRKEQNKIVDEFRKGRVNIIIATSMLEEGLDVQRCNLVIRFDPSATICSFIQSRGRARMQDSDFVLMIKRGDTAILKRVENYLASGERMRKECLSHASLPCEPLDNELKSEEYYKVETTGAIVTLTSSVSLLYFYCSRLPSDCYYRPHPRCVIDKELEICTLHLPKSCPIQTITVHGKTKILKQLACLEACRKLHQVGALTDNLVPDIVGAEADAEEFGYKPSYVEEQVQYCPQELVGYHDNESERLYCCYLIKLQQEFAYTVQPQDIVLATRMRLESDVELSNLDLDVDRGKLIVHVKYVGSIKLTSEQILLCQRFQNTVFKHLFNNNFYRLHEDQGRSYMSDCVAFDYLLLPLQGPLIDWNCIKSVLIQNNSLRDMHIDGSSPKCHGHLVHTKKGLVCTCMLQNSLVYTPHNGFMYCITGTLGDLDGNSFLIQNDDEYVTYKEYNERKHGIKLLFENEALLNGRHIFTVQNYLQRCRGQKAKEPSNASCELPPELCSVIMSPISISTFYSFSFLPSIMHRIESLLLASNLRRMHKDHCMQNVDIPIIKVLEAITTKKCQEKLHLESLETLGDSFLKYAAGQHVFKIYKKEHEGLLSIKKEKIISNATLCKLGCDRKIPGFIRNEPFNPKTWIIPGDNSANHGLDEELLSSRKVYVKGSRTLKSKVIADVVEALIGAFLSTGGESAALSFMAWLGINVDTVGVPYTRPFPVNPEVYVNVRYVESLLNYRFRDASYLVEALTHGSYMLPEIPRCYQRLEFLGDSVLDYVITVNLYHKYPGLSPGLLTDLRSASVNNDCYAQSAVKAGLHKHILHASQELHRHIIKTVNNSEELHSVSTFGWESEITYPKVLGDVIESLAGAIFVDSGYNKEIVFESIRPLLEPMVTLETLRLHPVRELSELCQKQHFTFKKPVVFRENGVSFVEVEVEADGFVHKESRSASDKKTAERLACKAVLNSLKERIAEL
ncbi:endoribonuclease Dicer homolog 2-like [Olea europaea var. sylvestris]|uniref:endoribonuclease Dicer homolog 2-like n=1 Tax=Olea europaea var. sylvestris TaxID=158386 RepID=UPI000C1D7C04|nr:endoribonuclease Dicer homolog 2-like [Olea europaea var. sylvestris]